MKKEISFEERKRIQLEMLIEIDGFCRSNDIRYSIAFGTLLGAVRHKGFIPWDDDVDIMMPQPDMERFKRIFKSESIKYCDVDTESHYEYDFSRLVNINTCNRHGMFTTTYGICIDLYPIVAVPLSEAERDLYFEKAEVINRKRLFYLRWRYRFLHYTPFKTLPGFDASIRKLRDFMLYKHEYGTTGCYYIVAGPYSLRDKMTYKFDLFSNRTEVEFEGCKFMSIADYHIFLTMRYGDYMQLPPEADRHPYHGGHYFWK